MSEFSKSIVSKRRKHSPDEKSKVLELSQEGKTPREISQLTGIAKTTIYDWTASRRFKKEQKQKKLSIQASHSDKTHSSKIASAKAMGFRELKIIQTDDVSQNAMIQICSPDGFTMLIPSLDEKILSLFFKERSVC